MSNVHPALRDKFYSFDGTWRTAEPSWRYVLERKQNVSGWTNWRFPLHQPAADVTGFGTPLGLRHIRAEAPAEPLTTAAAATAAAAAAKPSYASLQTSATLAASAMFNVSQKDQKRSGFMSETLTHTDYNDNDPSRWGRLGIMTRERMQEVDKYGDIAIPNGLHRTGTAPMRPAPSEKTGFTRGAAMHTAPMLTGGFVYVEPEVVLPPAADHYAFPERIAGRKCASGFAINNEHDALPPHETESHYTLTSIGFPGANGKVDKYGDLRERPPSVLELAAMTDAVPETLKMEESGFTRYNPTTGAVPDLIRQGERPVHPTQATLMRMANPIGYWDPHAHKHPAKR